MPGNEALVIPDATVYDTLFATLTPQEARRVAIVDGSTGSELTFGELRDRVDAFAGALAAHGIAPGDVVGLLAPNGPGFAIAFHGILRPVRRRPRSTRCMHPARSPISCRTPRRSPWSRCRYCCRTHSRPSSSSGWPPSG